MPYAEPRLVVRVPVHALGEDIDRLDLRPCQYPDKLSRVEVTRNIRDQTAIVEIQMHLSEWQIARLHSTADGRYGQHRTARPKELAAIHTLDNLARFTMIKYSVNGASHQCFHGVDYTVKKSETRWKNR
jgi:hypothetical protein